MNTHSTTNLVELLKQLENDGIPKAEQWKYINPFLESKSRKKHIPIHGIFELTPLCNFNCKMCYVHIENTDFHNQLLHVDSWKKIAIAAKRKGLKTVALTGGECLTYPEFDKLYTFLISSGFSVSIMSNGALFNDKLIDLLKIYRPAIIQISLYGSNEDAYEEVTGVRAFSIVLDNINKIKKSGINLSLSITPSSYMHDITNIIDLAEDLNIKYGINPQLITPRQNTGRIKSDISINEYLNIYRYLSKIHNNERTQIDWNLVPSKMGGTNPNFGIRCGAGRSTFGIKYDGTMCPCLSLDSIISKPLEVGFDVAWKQINEQAESLQLPLECGECIYKKQCLSCVAIHKDAPVQGHCDASVCERMKLLIHEGFVPLQVKC